MKKFTYTFKTKAEKSQREEFMNLLIEKQIIKEDLVLILSTVELVEEQE